MARGTWWRFRRMRYLKTMSKQVQTSSKQRSYLITKTMIKTFHTPSDTTRRMHGIGVNISLCYDERMKLLIDLSQSYTGCRSEPMYNYIASAILNGSLPKIMMAQNSKYFVQIIWGTILRISGCLLRSIWNRLTGWKFWFKPVNWSWKLSGVLKIDHGKILKIQNNFSLKAHIQILIWSFCW